MSVRDPNIQCTCDAVQSAALLIDMKKRAIGRTTRGTVWPPVDCMVQDMSVTAARVGRTVINHAATQAHVASPNAQKAAYLSHLKQCANRRAARVTVCPMVPWTALSM